MPKSETFVCPHEKCGKTFEKPILLIDSSKTPRETYHACPYCLSEVKLVVSNQEKLSRVSIETSKSLEERPPLKCPHHFELLKNLPEGASAPEECLTCSHVINCFIRKERLPQRL